MYLQFALVALLALTGLAQSGPSEHDARAHDRAVVASVASPEAEAPTLEERDIVVPPVDATGGVEAPVEPLATPSDVDPVVADQLVTPERLESAVVEAAGFQTLGMTWPEDSEVGELAGQVRTRADGTWSEWIDLVPADDAPDAGTADAAHALRGGTDSIAIGDADAVQLSFAATAEGGPDGLSLALVGSPLSAVTDGVVGTSASSDATVRTAAYSTGLVKAVPAPRVISRAEWQAPAQVCAPDVASSLVGAVVHHTAGSNNYSSVAEAMQQIRNDAAYHISGRGWCDIGYNFIVDKWGNIYEGRANSLNQAVIGVHAGGFNTGTVGVSMLGTYGAMPSAATQDGVARIIGWRLGSYGVNPQGSMSYSTGAGENSKFINQTVNLPRVIGHRDVAYTACPGDGGYAALGWIRARAASFAYSGPLVSALYSDMLGRVVDQGGLAAWTGALNNGTSAGQLASTLAISQEYATTEVRRAYVDVLRRQPDDAGLVNWTNAVMGGVLRPEDLRGALIASQEYYNNAGGSDPAYITALYRDILFRAPQAAEASGWLSVIATTGRGTVSHGVWKSMESARIRVDEAYHQYLGRSADQAGIGGWAPVLQSRGEGALRSAIVDSDEYMQRAFARF
ncbi:DUF4214 domain-containing protein [Pengzhenrongella frigida]|uniref:DUF4214 domain-containing protein n=1 Tax=Pengzhenrongella frigida TaxID=1259133 RepID=A0A4Q5MZZ5_9MICO|nr:DUF4214 domain-containing protein [Cellulomonas sp. HLT2-17]RYV51358.1 DUF4214 domain-containing protein [Cellulomonas sp. HLT2-17]